MRNGVVRITSRYKKEGREHTGTAHVHQYATSVIRQELQRHASRYEMTVEERRITLECIDGPDEGRRSIFTPEPGDETGWDEMLTFARVLQTIWHAGYELA